MPRFLIVITLVWAVAGGCGGTPPPTDRTSPPVIDGIDVPNPALVGSEIRVTGLRFELLGSNPVLDIEGTSLELLREGEPGELFYELSTNAVRRLGDGIHVVPVTLVGQRSTASFEATFDIATELPIGLDRGLSGEVSRNELALLNGQGFLAASEGEVLALFDGTFTNQEGETAEVEAELPVLPAGRNDRTRGLVRLSSALGGILPGRFVGQVTLRSVTVNGRFSESAARQVDVTFGPPILFELTPNVASLEQLVTVRGAGFLGGDAEPDEATIVRLEGMFARDGGEPQSFGPAELVPEWVSGGEMRGELDARVVGNRLVSSLFGAPSGRFQGTATPISIKGRTEVIGPSVPFEFTLAPPVQVVYVRFLAPLYDSLTRFGLASAAGVIEPLVIERIESIYSDWRIDARLERPEDFSPNGYAILEIGGPDPNGVGLFGYDNTPGKDIGNVRLFDQIGGANAETQEDGYPGFGGVFVESMLYFSSHPDLPGPEPRGRPDPDPLFDEIFDPVRARPATLSEIQGDGPADRTSEVDRALRALASMIGETTAHELGHSLGLADPFGPPTAFHNPFDGDGCLMDSGGSRPVGERTAQPGFTETHLCQDGPVYLSEILGD